jgi:Ubiquitin family
MQVFVKILSGNTVTLEVKSSETALFLKDRIQEMERFVFRDCLVTKIVIAHISYHSVPPDQQRMFTIIELLLLWH